MIYSFTSIYFKNVINQSMADFYVKYFLLFSDPI